MRRWTLLSLLVACGGPRTTAAPIEACTGSLRPLVVEWTAADRGSLEVRLREGPVAVRYEGCALELLPRCEVPGAYTYTGVTTKQDRVEIRDRGELRMHLPFGAGRFESRLARAGELSVDMTLVGTYEADRAGYTRDDLRGPCHAATHVLTAAQVGAFAFYAGASAELSARGELLRAAVGRRSSHARELLTTDGDPAACAASSSGDAAAPETCAALVRVELSPLLAWRSP